MTTTTRSKILLADDDMDMLNMVKKGLEGIDAEIEVAMDGREAVRLARQNRPDLIVLDVMMPGMSGWEVCKAIREDETLRKTPVLMLTGIGEKLNELTSPLYGADAYLDKPFDLEQLDQTARELLSRG